MDRNVEDMKSVGFFGIFNQSFKTIFSSKKLFTQITLTSILLLTIIFLADLKISDDIFWRINNNLSPYDIKHSHDSRKPTSLDWVYFWLYEVAYFIFITIFSLLSTATVVFTVASIYTARDVTFRHVMNIIPKIWLKLFVTFVFIYLTFFIYDVILRVIMVILKAVLGESTLGFGVLIFIILIIYILGFLYLTVVCQLASVVTVLENVYGFKAMKKGKRLAKGKKKVGMAISFLLYLILVGLVSVYYLFVEYGHDIFEWGLFGRVMMGILVGVLLMILFLLIMVTQTVLYLVCKSYHRETVDKPSLSKFLGAYNGETEPGDGIQLERPQSQPPLEQV